MRGEGPLTTLLGGPPDRLFAAWDRRPLVFRGPASRLVDLMGPVAADPIRWLPQMACSDPPDDIDAIAPVITCHANHDHSDWLADRADVRPYLPIAPAGAARAVAGGASVQFNGVEHATDARWSPVARLARQCLAELGLVGRVGVALTWSPPGARFAPHVDPAGACVVQLVGRKAYTVGESPWCDPPAKAHLFDDGSLRTPHGVVAPGAPAPPTRVHHMGPGDVLYLAPGVLHATEAIEESVSLLFMWMTHDAAAWIGDVIARLGVGGRLPVGRPGPDGALPPPLRAALAERLDDLRAWLDADHPEWAFAWHHSVARDSGGLDPPTDPRPARLALSPDPRVRLVRSSAVSAVVVGGEEISVGGPWRALFARLAAGPVTVEGLSDELGFDRQVLGRLLDDLYRRGVLIDASGPGQA